MEERKVSQFSAEMPYVYAIFVPIFNVIFINDFTMHFGFFVVYFHL